MSEIVLKFYSDPGHGWLAVKRTMLIEYGLADRISAYSYQNGDTVYLEEDDDAGKMILALKSWGKTVKVREKSTDKRSVIRSYDRYTA